jgi:hypothetical protein
MPMIQVRDKRPYGQALERVCIKVDPVEWAVFCALMGDEFNTSASDGVRQLVARVVREHKARGRTNARTS